MPLLFLTNDPQIPKNAATGNGGESGITSASAITPSSIMSIDRIPKSDPPKEVLDRVRVLQHYLWSIQVDRERQRKLAQSENETPCNSQDKQHVIQSPTTRNKAHDSDREPPTKMVKVDNDAQALVPPTSMELNQIFQVVTTLFGSHSTTTTSPCIVEAAMALLDSAEFNITRVVSLTSQRSMYLIRADRPSKDRIHYPSSDQIESSKPPPSPPSEPFDHDDNDDELQQEPIMQSPTSSPSYYFCRFPEESSEDASFFHCSCRSYFDQTMQGLHPSCPPANEVERGKHHCVGTTDSPTFLCEHLLALLLAPALVIPMAVLEMKSDHDFAELVIGRIGLS